MYIEEELAEYIFSVITTHPSVMIGERLYIDKLLDGYPIDDIVRILEMILYNVIIEIYLRSGYMYDYYWNKHHVVLHRVNYIYGETDNNIYMYSLLSDVNGTDTE